MEWIRAVELGLVSSFAALSSYRRADYKLWLLLGLLAGSLVGYCAGTIVGCWRCAKRNRGLQSLSGHAVSSARPLGERERVEEVLVSDTSELAKQQYNLPGRPVYHERIILLPVPLRPGCFQILTPDNDRYEEDYGPASEDVEEVVLLSGIGAAADGIEEHWVYRFRVVPTDASLQVMVRSLHLRYGMAGVAPTVVLKRPGMRVEEEVDPPGHVWVIMESRENRRRGDIVAIQDKRALCGDRGVIQENGVSILVARVRPDQAAAVSGEDVRVLPVAYDQQGERKRAFTEAVSRISADAPDLSAHLQGPPSLLWLCKHVLANGGSFAGNHELWRQTSGVAANDRSVYEGEVLAK
eukprot:3351442-Amphidinium_carterae.1